MMPKDNIQFLQDKLEKLIAIAKETYGLHFSTTPLLKPLVSIFGSQSSGKSSLLNYLFGNIPVRQTGTHAVDSCFTILETVDEQTFIDLCGSKYHEPDAIDDFWLHQPRLKGNDPRENCVWKELDSVQSQQRYRQFFNSDLGEELNRYNLVKAIVINEKFVKGTELDSDNPVVKDLIFIDTPGFNSESTNGSIEKFNAYVNVLEFFYRQSVRTLFMLDPEKLRSSESSFKLLELTLADKEVRRKIFSQATSEIANQSSSTTGTNFSVSGFVYSLAYKALSDYSQKLETSEKGKQTTYQYIGSSMYQKLFFIISKCDKVQSLHTAFFELGLVLGRRFTNFPLPHASQVLTIGIPHEQRIFRTRFGFNENESIKALRKKYKLMMETYTENGVVHPSISIGQLKELEDILNNIRGDDIKIQTMLHYIRYVFDAIAVAREYKDSTFFAKYTKKAFHKFRAPFSVCQTLVREAFTFTQEDNTDTSTEEK